MKFISYILCIYILLLAVMPCGDEIDCTGTETHTELTSSTHDEHEGEMEHCSPFCICACCGQLTGTPLATGFDFEIQPKQLNDVVFNYTQKPSKLSFKIWQPPKIS